ncbi:MAG: hypothetical protein MUO21_00950 [Nitrososphaeraceae archaeon]|nr:hypothetical protein [Nitrososphaeraceae archaeon]
MDWADDIDPIKFSEEAISLVKKISVHLEVHSAFRDIIEHLSPFKIDAFGKFFEQQLASYIINYVKNKNIIEYCHTIEAINFLISDLINRGYDTFSSTNTIAYMLYTYPLTIVADICKTTIYNAYIIGESVKKFIEVRQSYHHWMPNVLSITTVGFCELAGEQESPLSKIELDALYQYLGVKKQIYVHMLLNCLYDFVKYDRYLNSGLLNEEHIIDLSKSSWFYLFLFASIQNVN